MTRRILLADDDEAIRRVVSEYLRDEGFEVTVAGNGLEALRLALIVRPDLAIVDVMMPVMDARPMLALWAKEPDLQSVPVVLVSAAARLADLAHHSVVRTTLPKPFDLAVLRAIVDQLLTHPKPPPIVPLET